METEEFKDPVIHGLISLVISVVVTYGVSMVIPSEDVIWALYAVAFASFFSSAFSIYFHEEE